MTRNPAQLTVILAAAKRAYLWLERPLAMFFAQLLAFRR
jgi:hypothetical protein